MLVGVSVLLSESGVGLDVRQAVTRSQYMIVTSGLLSWLGTLQSACFDWKLYIVAQALYSVKTFSRPAVW